MKQNFKPGDYVYFIDRYDNNLEGTVKDIFNFPNCPTHNNYYIISTRYGSVTVIEENIFKTEKERSDELIKRHNIQVKGYCDAIKDYEDLIVFMFNHTVSFAEEYTDWEAREAVRIKAKEFGIELN